MSNFKIGDKVTIVAQDPGAASFQLWDKSVHEAFAGLTHTLRQQNRSLPYFWSTNISANEWLHEDWMRPIVAVTIPWSQGPAASLGSGGGFVIVGGTGSAPWIALTAPPATQPTIRPWNDSINKAIEAAYPRKTSFDGFCDKATYPNFYGWCGGMREHKLGCPHARKIKEIRGS